MAEAEKPQKQVKLTKTLRRWDLIFFSVCAIISLDAVAGIASWGLGAGVVWFFLFVFIFLLPYGLVTAELGAAFPAEGGIYTWVRMAYGKLAGSLTSIQYWIANPFWIGGSLAAVTIASINAFFLKPNGYGEVGTLWSIIIGLIFVWINIIIAVISLKYGKWAANIGAWVKAIAVFSFVVLILANLAKHGLPHGIAPASSYMPSVSNFLAVIGGIVFLFVGFELESGASDEMLDPQRDVPVGILRSGIITAVLYVLVVGGILLTLPMDQLSLGSGFTGAFQWVTQNVLGTGGGAKALGYFFGAIVILALISSGSVWILGSARVQAVAALDGAAPRGAGQVRQGRHADHHGVALGHHRLDLGDRRLLGLERRRQHAEQRHGRVPRHRALDGGALLHLHGAGDHHPAQEVPRRAAAVQGARRHGGAVDLRHPRRGLHHHHRHHAAVAGADRRHPGAGLLDHGQLGRLARVLRGDDPRHVDRHPAAGRHLLGHRPRRDQGRRT